MPRLRRALFVSYLYPPVGGITPRVALNYTRALVEAGFDVDVITPDPSPRHPVYRIDPSLVGHELPGVKVHRTFPGPFYRLSCRFGPKPVARNGNRENSLERCGATRGNGASPDDGPGAEPSGHRSTAEVQRFDRWRPFYQRAVRGWFVPDTRVDWYGWGVAKGRDLLRRHRYDVLVSVGFPWTSHFIALSLRGRPALPWVLHQGDVWSFQPARHAPRWRDWLDRRLERALLMRGQRFVVNTRETAEAYARQFPEIPTETFVAIPTGYEPKIYEAEPERSPRFRLVYTGAVSDVGRGHRSVLEGVARARAAGATEIEFVIAGSVPQWMRDLAARLGLTGVVSFLGFRPTEEVARLQKSADVLVLFGMVGGLQVPAKLWEYYAARRPILIVPSDEQDVAARDIESQSRGTPVADEAGAVSRVLLSMHEAWRNSRLDEPYSLKGVPALSWEQAGRRFVEVLDQAMSG